MQTFNEQYFALVEDKMERKVNLKKVQDFYYDEAQFFMSPDTLHTMMLEMHEMQGEINAINTKLDKMRESLTAEDLKAMKKEFDKWRAS